MPPRSVTKLRARMIMEVMGEYSGVSIYELEERLPYTASQIRKVLYVMKAQGLVEAEGKGTDLKLYYLTKSELINPNPIR